ncbi:YfiR family protein [Paucibacter sp. APW11]|uniref:YfiR family protein n=1 Tax=Roseateles aquae TaxID=3077235 RepID=A0ABU3P9V8_9BURK|nr:YfiR family protein [Paucibacter sp. APW11]MDT8999361.1 YfiR family protein [Paucibacter sp. APW11]
MSVGLSWPTRRLKGVPRLCLPAVLSLGLAHAAPLQDESQLKAAFIYRFAQFTQWPPPPLKEFNYCIAGNAELQESLRAIARKPHDGIGARLQVLTAPPAPGQCQLLVMALSDRNELQRWQAALGDEPVLVVGDTPEAFRAGASIALVLEPNGLSFRINYTEAKRRGLVLSSQVLKLAREVR